VLYHHRWWAQEQPPPGGGVGWGFDDVTSRLTEDKTGYTTLLCTCHMGVHGSIKAIVLTLSSLPLRAVECREWAGWA
jgi:hypothetical protein